LLSSYIERWIKCTCLEFCSQLRLTEIKQKCDVSSSQMHAHACMGTTRSSIDMQLIALVHLTLRGGWTHCSVQVT
jgi:hypothetical protein